MFSINSGATRLATRIAFFVAGFGLACWAPLIPLVRARLQLDPAVLGMLLLCMGIGSVSAMSITNRRAVTRGRACCFIRSRLTISGSK